MNAVFTFFCVSALVSSYIMLFACAKALASSVVTALLIPLSET